jgi:hypothetical protein
VPFTSLVIDPVHAVANHASSPTVASLASVAAKTDATIEDLAMLTDQSNGFLRRVLLLDAVSSGGMGLLALLFTTPIAGLLNLPVGLLTQVGLVLLPFAAFLGYLVSRPAPSRLGVWIVIGLNVLWVIDSVLILVTGWVEPNALGYAVVIGQALAVGVFAELEYVGLRRGRLALA